MSNFEPRIDFEEAWNYVQKRIKRLQDNLEGLPNTHFSSEDNMMLYTNIYILCTRGNHCEKLYEKYKETFDEYIKSTVLPSLQEKKDELLSRELLRRWSNHKTMTIRLSKFFRYLDMYYLRGSSRPSLQEASFLSFYHLVCDNYNLKTQVKDAILTMIDRKLAGETIDETLFNNVLALYSEIGDITRKDEPKEFAETMMMKANAMS